jgi:hypothetical protein
MDSSKHGVIKKEYMEAWAPIFFILVNDKYMTNIKFVNFFSEENKICWETKILVSVKYTNFLALTGFEGTVVPLLFVVLLLVFSLPWLYPFRFLLFLGLIYLFVVIFFISIFTWPVVSISVFFLEFYFLVYINFFFFTMNHFRT